MNMLDQIKEFTVPQNIADDVEYFICKSQEIDFKYKLETVDETFKEQLESNLNINRKEIDGIKINDLPYFGKMILSLSKHDDGVHRFNIDLVCSQRVKKLQDYIALNLIKEPVFAQLIRVNCFTRVSENEGYFISHPHPDVNSPYIENCDNISVLYYVNDSCGETHFFDTNSKKLIKKTPSKKGNVIVFNPTIVHAAQYPVNDNARFTMFFQFTKMKVLDDCKIEFP